MAVDLPPLSYGYVKARFVAGIGESVGSPTTPDAIPLTGTVTFNLSAAVIRVTTALPVPTTVYPQPITADVDADGYLMWGGAPLVPLLATDDPAMNPTDLQWTVSFDLRTPDGYKVPSEPWRFILPTGATVDLTDVAPIAIPAPNVVITKGDKGDPGQLTIQELNETIGQVGSGLFVRVNDEGELVGPNGEAFGYEDLVEPLTATKTQNQSRVSSASAGPDGEMALPLEPDTWWELDGVLEYEAGTGGDFKLQWQLPTNATMQWGLRAPYVTANGDPATGYFGSITASGIGRGAGFGAGVPVLAQVRGRMYSGDGDLPMRPLWGQNTSDATPTILRAGSWIRATRAGKPSKPLSGNVWQFGGVPFVVQSPEKDWSLSLSSTKARIELRSRDQWRGDMGGGKERCELNSTGYPLDTELWFAFQAKISGAIPEQWLVFAQMQQRPENLPGRTETIGKPPALALRLDGDVFSVETRTDAAEVTTVPQNDRQTVRFVEHNWSAAHLGQVRDYVGRVKFNWQGQGILQVWRQGVLIVNDIGIDMGYNDIARRSLPSFKVGAYRAHDEGTVIVEVANVVAPQVTSLLDRVTSPPVWPG